MNDEKAKQNKVKEKVPYRINWMDLIGAGP